MHEYKPHLLNSSESLIFLFLSLHVILMLMRAPNIYFFDSTSIYKTFIVDGIFGSNSLLYLYSGNFIILKILKKLFNWPWKVRPEASNAVIVDCVLVISSSSIDVPKVILWPKVVLPLNLWRFLIHKPAAF